MPMPLTRDNSPLPASILEILRQTSEAAPDKVLAALQVDGEGTARQLEEIIAVIPTTNAPIPTTIVATPRRVGLPPRVPLSIRPRQQREHHQQPPQQQQQVQPLSAPSTPSSESAASSDESDGSEFGGSASASGSVAATASVGATPQTFALGASAFDFEATADLRDDDLDEESSASASSSASSSSAHQFSPRSTNQLSWFNLFTPPNGTFIQRMGHSYVWTADHPRISTLSALRARGDPDADEVLEALDCGFSGDVVAIMADRAARHKQTLADASEAANSAEVRERSIDALCFRFLDKYSRVPEWVDWAAVGAGQAVFTRYCQSALLSLMYSSLLGGFGAPLINKTLTSTNYLSGNCPATYRRLVETTAMISACVGPDTQSLESPWVADDELPPKATTNGAAYAAHRGDGWLASLRVRFLHAKVRSMLRARPDWDEETYGVPINQEDMLATLLAFSFNVPWALTHVDLHIGSAECEQYIHLWRYIGWLSGVSPDSLDAYLVSHAKSKQCSEAIMYHLVHPDETSCRMAAHVLNAVHKCFPLRWSFDFHLALARALMTDEWADSLQLPKASRVARWQVRGVFWCTRAIATVSYVHPAIQRFACRVNWTLLSRALERFHQKTLAGREKAKREEAGKQQLLHAHRAHPTTAADRAAAPLVSSALPSSSSLPSSAGGGGSRSTFHSKLRLTSDQFRMYAENAPTATDQGLHIDEKRAVFPDARTCPFLAAQKAQQGAPVAAAASSAAFSAPVTTAKDFSEPIEAILVGLFNGFTLKRISLGVLSLMVALFVLRRFRLASGSSWPASRMLRQLWSAVARRPRLALK